MSKLSPTSLDDYKSAFGMKLFSVSYGSGVSKTFCSYVNQSNTQDFDKTLPECRSLLSGDVGRINPLYDTSKTLVHNLTTRRHKYPYADDFDYQHIYSGITDREGSQTQNSVISFAQAMGTIYAIDQMDKYGHYYVNDEIYSWLCRVNGYSFPKVKEIHTVLYDPNITTAAEEDLSSMLSCIDNIQYNTLYEVPGNVVQDVCTGSILGTSVKCKNQYTHEYSMEHNLTASPSPLLLTHARSYSEVCNCNDIVYLKYNDRVKYSKSGDDEQHHRFASKNSEQDTKSYGYSLPHIEVIKNLNRGAAPAAHKSTLYSIGIQAQFLQEFKQKALAHVSSDVADTIVSNIKNEIKNCVRQLVEKISPANSQLLAVTVD